MSLAVKLKKTNPKILNEPSPNETDNINTKPTDIIKAKSITRDLQTGTS